jgi:threonine aldolase
MRSFGSDNHSGAHPRILQAIERANRDHALSYGSDPWTAELEEVFRSHFGPEAKAYPVYNGTGANVLGLATVLSPHQSVVCADTSHLQQDECGALERFTGARLLLVKSREGKLDEKDLAKVPRAELNSPHHSVPSVLSVSQVTECGTLYSLAELKALAKLAHSRDWLFHLDGARISNACAALDVSLKAMTTDLGVDVLSFGGTKNGLLLGEAVVFLKAGLDRHFAYVRKQGMQLASKQRLISAQFTELLKDGLWLENARHANKMARRLADGAGRLPGVRLSSAVQANAVFALLEAGTAEILRQKHPFYVWNASPEQAPGQVEVRWMTTWDSTEAEVDAFLASLGELTGRQ